MYMLRDYQEEICSRVREAFKKHRSVMMQMPTGTGKTVVLAEIVREYLNVNVNVNVKGGCNVLIVAHRRELVEQIQQALLRVMGAGVARELPTQQSCDCLIQVHSIQWLSRNIEKVKGKPGVVIVDEAHHAVAKTYRMMWEAWPEAKFLGLTATPYRLSGEGFTDLFEVMVESWSVKRFIAEGWLSAFDYYSILPESDEQRLIDSLKKRGADGDFLMKEMHEALDVTPCIERLFESFERFAYDKKGIVYAIDIEHAEHIAEYYRQQGVAAYAISSKTSLPERKRLIEAFRKRVFLPHPSSPARRGSTSLLNPPLLRREDLKPGRPGLYSQTSSRPCGVARELPTQQSCDCLCAEGAAAREGCDCLVSEGVAAHIAVHSIQWLSRNIEKVKGKPGLVIVDEAHHALAKTYKMMWEAWPEAKFLGLTATPWRMSGEGFTDLFEVMVQSWSVKRFIAEGWLCAYDYYAVRPDSDDQRRIDSLTKRGTDGDYQTKEMREKLDDAPCIERLFETYMQHAKGMKGIVYAIDIEHAEHIADYYKQQGVAAYAISSKTSINERKRLIEAFRKSCFSEEKSSNDIFENHPPSPSLPLKKGLHRFPLNPLSPQGTGDLKPGRPGLYEQTSSRP